MGLVGFTKQIVKVTIVVDEGDVDNVNKLFDHIDRDKDGSLTYAEIQSACD